MIYQKEIDDMFINILENISQICDRTSSGNITHNINTIKCKCRDMLSFYKKYPVSYWHSVADGDLPKEQRDYICDDGYSTRIGWFDTSDNQFYDSYPRSDEKLKVKYWMKISKLPDE